MSAPFTHHGGDLASARARFGGAAADWIDLSTGINPQPWPGATGIAIDWRPLPDRIALADLETQAAGYFGADPLLCRAVPGSEAGLRLLAPLLGLPGRHLALSYRTHADAFAIAEPASEPFARPKSATTLIIANPNNPDGQLRTHAELLGVLARQEAVGGWLIVDEAFADCRAETSVCNLVANTRRLIVMRSFGKFFGLAGVRLGFVVAPRAVLVQLCHRLGDWPVNAAALTLGMAAYADTAWIADTRSALPVKAAALDALLGRHGLVAEGHCPLFRLIRTPRAQTLFTGLAKRRILTRPFADQPDLLRIGLPADGAALDRLDQALGVDVVDG
jgi:cobalamin biosynthetic protein CobC